MRKPKISKVKYCLADIDYICPECGHKFLKETDGEYAKKFTACKDKLLSYSENYCPYCNHKFDNTELLNPYSIIDKYVSDTIVKKLFNYMLIIKKQFSLYHTKKTKTSFFVTNIQNLAQNDMRSHQTPASSIPANLKPNLFSRHQEAYSGFLQLCNMNKNIFSRFLFQDKTISLPQTKPFNPACSHRTPFYIKYCFKKNTIINIVRSQTIKYPRHKKS